MHVYVGQSCDLHQPQYLPMSATTLANTGTCIGHNTCIRRPQYLFMSARAVVCVDHNICLRWPTLGPASATSPVYICRPQYLFMSARAVTCIGHNMCLRQPQHLFTSVNTGTCVGHIIVPATGQWHSRIPGTSLAQCAGPGNGSCRHSVMALCVREAPMMRSYYYI